MKTNRLYSILFAILLILFALPALSTGVFAQKTTPAKATVKTVGKKIPVPKNWDYIYDKKKGYGFHVPAGSTLETESYKGVDVAALTTPAPTKIDIFVLAFKDKTFTKEDLLETAVLFLEEMGQEVTPGVLKAESEDYAVADAATVHPELGKGKLRILVGTDISDNYIMIIGTTVKNFDANEETIDAIWGSFEMWSGGASGKN
jgi:hypothetical protein